MGTPSPPWEGSDHPFTENFFLNFFTEKKKQLLVCSYVIASHAQRIWFSPQIPLCSRSGCWEISSGSLSLSSEGLKLDSFYLFSVKCAALSSRSPTPSQLSNSIKRDKNGRKTAINSTYHHPSQLPSSQEGIPPPHYSRESAELS